MKTIEIDRNGQVVTIALNRPEVRNALNADMIEELSRTFAEASTNPTTRVIVLRGNGPSFSAGADINWMRASLDFSREENIADAQRLSDMFAAMDSCNKPVVSRVHGAALGGGMGLLAVSDIVIAGRETVFGFTEAKLGIIPAVISRFVVPKTGASWARALYLTAERFGPDLAREIGLVHWIADPEDLDGTVDEKVQELLSSGPQAVREAKRLIRGVVGRDASEHRDYTAERIAALRTSEEGQEGLRAFLERREPAWRASL